MARPAFPAHRRISLLFAAMTVVAGLAILANRAEAAPVQPLDCTETVAKSVTDTLGCQYVVEAIDDTPRPDAVNAIGFFGFGDWRLFETYTGFPGELTAVDTGCAKSEDCLIFDIAAGEYAVKPLNPALLNVLLLFGAPDGADAPGGLVAYLLGPEATSGTFQSMFTDATGTPVDIAFLSVYARRAEMAVIPLPAPALLLFSALAGLGLVARRRRIG